MLRYLLQMLALTPLSANSAGTTDALSFAVERCILPQIEGRKIPTEGLLSITPRDAGANLGDDGPMPNFFRSSEEGHIIGELRLFFTLHTCTVPRFEGGGFDEVKHDFLTRTQTLGFEISQSCENAAQENDETVMVMTPEPNRRGHFVTAILAEDAETELFSIFAYETTTSNLETSCDSATNVDSP